MHRAFLCVIVVIYVSYVMHHYVIYEYYKVVILCGTSEFARVRVSV